VSSANNPGKAETVARKVAGAGGAAEVAALDLAAAPMQPSARSGYFRWVVCALIFLATTINYIDRQVIGILKPVLQGELRWNEIDYSNIVFAFQLAYAIGLLLMGRVMDWLGTRKGFSLAALAWSVAAMAHALARSVMGFSAVRFALGLSESGNFPAAIKTIAEWFPRKERALATGFLNAGTNVGAMTTPLIVPWITYNYGWRWAFIATGALGFLWLIAWLAIYGPPESHARVSKAELAYIRGDPPEPKAKIAWAKLFPHRQTWAFAFGKFMTDPIWWVYLFWVPDFLHKRHGITLLEMGLPLVAIYVIADIGSIGGGWFSSALIKRGWTVNAGRKTAMLVCALAVVPIVFASKVSHLWVAVGLVGLAAAAHQGWSANLFTLTSDMFPRRAVGSVVGIGGMAGAVGGMLIAKVVGYVLEWTGSYLPVFIIAGSAYLTAFVVIQLLVPKLEPAPVEANQMR
jgi:MFS transporter, ACS family, aldohexuronate transporter